MVAAEAENLLAWFFLYDFNSISEKSDNQIQIFYTSEIAAGKAHSFSQKFAIVFPIHFASKFSKLHYKHWQMITLI